MLFGKINRYNILLLLTSVIISGCIPKAPYNPVQQAAQEMPPPPPPPPVVVKKIEPAQLTAALLLPLSGPSKDLGQAMLDAAQLALINTQNNTVRLLPLDTETSPQAAASDVRTAMNKGANIIIGPIFSKTTMAASSVSRANNLPLLSFSNNKDLKSSTVFVLGFLPDQQITRITKYALSKGITDFYVLAPSNTYGKMAVDTLANSLADSDGSIIKTEFYPANGGDGFTISVNSIADALKEAGKTGKTALVIPEGGDRLALIINQLTAARTDFSHIQLIGSSEWDDGITQKIPQLNGGWFAGSSPEQRALFEQQFLVQYGYKPVRIASLAYDAVALVAALQSQGNNTITLSALTTPQGFMGVDGIFRLQPDGLSQRGLAVLQITNGAIQMIDPAPIAFDPLVK